MHVAISFPQNVLHAPVVPVPQSPELAIAYGAGTHLFFEGDDANCLFLIESGVVRLTRFLEDGRRQVVSFGYPGDVVGFAADDTHCSDCDALVDTRARPLRRSAMLNRASDPALHDFLLQASLREIVAMQDHFLMLGRKSASEKLASFLKTMVVQVGNGHAGIDLPMSRSDIADFLGLTKETVSRCFTSLRKAGVIRLRGNATFDVLDWQALCRRAGGTQA